MLSFLLQNKSSDSFQTFFCESYDRICFQMFSDDLCCESYDKVAFQILFSDICFYDSSRKTGKPPRPLHRRSELAFFVQMFSGATARPAADVSLRLNPRPIFDWQRRTYDFGYTVSSNR